MINIENGNGRSCFSGFFAQYFAHSAATVKCPKNFVRLRLRQKTISCQTSNEDMIDFKYWLAHQPSSRADNIL